MPPRLGIGLTVAEVRKKCIMRDFGVGAKLGYAAAMGIWLRDGDSERPTMLAELFAAADEWRQSGKRLDLGRALAQVDPSLVDPQTGLTRGNVFGLYREVLGIHFVQDTIDQLRPLSETQGAVARASMLGLEPRYVFPTVDPRGATRGTGSDRTGRSGGGDRLDWELGVGARADRCRWAGRFARVRRTPSYNGADSLACLVGAPRAHPTPVAHRRAGAYRLHRGGRAVGSPHRRADVPHRTGVVGLGRALRRTATLVRAHSLGRSWHPLHYPDTFDPADGVLPQLLRVAVGLVDGWGDRLPALLSAEKAREIWEGSRAALEPLVESACARTVARVLGIEWVFHPSPTSKSVPDLVWRLVLLEAILRVSAGAVRALAMERLEWLAEYQDVMQQFDEWAAKSLWFDLQGS